MKMIDAQPQRELFFHVHNMQNLTCNVKPNASSVVEEMETNQWRL